MDSEDCSCRVLVAVSRFSVPLQSSDSILPVFHTSIFITTQTESSGPHTQPCLSRRQLAQKLSQACSCNSGNVRLGTSGTADFRSPSVPSCFIWLAVTYTPPVTGYRVHPKHLLLVSGTFLTLSPCLPLTKNGMAFFST